MSSWRYGISKARFGAWRGYALVEKYSISGNDMETADPIQFFGDDPQEIIRSLEHALKDCKAEIDSPAP